MLKNCQMLLKSILLAIVGALLLSAGLHAQTYTDLYDFSCDSGGCLPYDIGQLTQGIDGNLYGTTSSGGRFGNGTIFMVTPQGAHADLWSFDGVSGAAPVGALTLASDGNFYGTAAFGGAYGNGTVFRFTAPSSVTVLHSFNGSDGANPAVPPTQGGDANLYGVSGTKTTYRIALPSGTFQQLPENVSSSNALICNVPIACFPYDQDVPLYLASDGNLYGTSFDGVLEGYVFRMTTDGDITDIYSFTGYSDGYMPLGPVTQGQGADVRLYGTTFNGGAGAGTIFALTLEGVFTSLHAFDFTNQFVNNDGEGPADGVLAASDGLLYGVTTSLGAHRDGTLYLASKDGSLFQKIFDFPGTGPEAVNGGPWATLIQHTNGTLYGLTLNGSYVDGNFVGNFYSITPARKIQILKIAGPIFVRPGVPVQILGDDLTQTFSISFAGEPMQFDANSDTYLTARVPSDAVDDVIAVTLQSGLQVQTQSTIHILPVVTSLDPLSGPVGTQVVEVLRERRKLLLVERRPASLSLTRPACWRQFRPRPRRAR